MKWFISLVVPLMYVVMLSMPVHAAALEEVVKEHHLPNGLTVLIVERHSAPTVAAWIRYRVGSVHENSNERGIAHLLEHMLFKGTKTLGTKNYQAEQPLLEEIEQIALAVHAERAKGTHADKARIALLEKKLSDAERRADAYVVKDEFFDLYARHGGNGYNAFTSKDATTYLISLPSNKLELWAAIESDRMKNPVLREFYTERAVVMEERRRSYEAEPSAKLWESFIASAFPAHPYGQPIIGWTSDIEYLTRTKAESFLHRYYTPNNATIVVVGDVQAEATLKLIVQYFGDVPAGQAVPAVSTREEPQQGERRVSILAAAEPELLIGFHKTAQADPDDAVFDVLAGILGQGQSSRLYRRLVVEKQLATSVTVFDAPGNRYPNLLVFHLTPRAPHTLAELEQAVYQELGRLSTEPVTTEELTRVRNRVLFQEAQGSNSNTGLARLLMDFDTATGSWRSLVSYQKAITGVTAEDITRIANRYLKEENRVVGTLVTRKP